MSFQQSTTIYYRVEYQPSKKSLSLFQVGRMEGPRLLEEGRLLQHVHAAEAHQRLLRFGVEYSTYDVHNIFRIYAFPC